jgi:hypothetical protein
VVHRVAGPGSLGRQRWVALADWQGGSIAREAKALLPSSVLRASKGQAPRKILYQEVLSRAVRAPDPLVRPESHLLVRRLSPDCLPIELAALAADRDEVRLLTAMGVGDGKCPSRQLEGGEHDSGRPKDACCRLAPRVHQRNGAGGDGGLRGVARSGDQRTPCAAQGMKSA